MTGVFLSAPRYDWCAPLSHPSSMLVNHGPSEQNFKEEYKPWKWVLMQGTTHLIQRSCYQRGSLYQDAAGNRTTRRPGHRKEMQTEVVWTCLRSWGLVKPSCKARWKRKEDKADRKRGGKTTPGNGQTYSSQSPRGQWRAEKNGGKWLWSHLWCPNDPRGKGKGERRKLRWRWISWTQRVWHIS